MNDSKKQESQGQDFERLVDRLLANEKFLDGITESLKGRLNSGAGTGLGLAIKAFESAAGKARQG